MRENMSFNLPSRTKTIDGQEYTINVMSGWVQMTQWLYVQSIIAPALGELLDSKNIDPDIAALEQQHTFNNILTLLTQKMDDPKFLDLIKLMLKGSTAGNEILDPQSDEMLGKGYVMFELVLFALEENFKDFFTKSTMFQSFKSIVGKAQGITED